jgi:hypothetical protein
VSHPALPAIFTTAKTRQADQAGAEQPEGARDRNRTAVLEIKIKMKKEVSIAHEKRYE